jgi:hypothetical protein
MGKECLNKGTCSFIYQHPWEWVELTPFYRCEKSRSREVEGLAQYHLLREL